MRKFEIVNDTWIKKIVFEEFMKEYLLDAIKINSITAISATYKNEPEWVINLQVGSANRIFFCYNGSEEDDFNKDLAFLKRLLNL